ncbi:glucokinase [Frigidibacter sp. ROC022]|uniref:glucokinase n=1 Tax=Frigidibacter sp. ROC022 TaxID=2971796 RepID=UPI00215B1E24|nr:glucokinase [Frigidibacter sp. ROC022]MCR8723946.1 glucokinase [Frigidibacter sp. ROC022]
MALAADRYSLVADVGGTNTRVALAEGRTVLPATIRRYPNQPFVDRGEGLEAVLAAYVDELDGVDCEGAAVAIAGPVRDGAGELTNLSWRMDRETLARVTRAERAVVLNDLQAQGHALDDLAPGSVKAVQSGRASAPGAARLVIGAGTGFNAAPVFDTAGGRIVPPSEAGHVSLPLRGEEDFRLARYLESEVPIADGFASVEEVLSGRGLEHVYLWLGTEAGDPVPRSAKAIMACLADGSDPRAEATARVYVRMLGNVAGNLALTLLPYGGIYFIGGVVRAMRPWLEPFGFAAAFADKGRFGEFLTQFPVSVIEDDYAALTGCASFLDTQRGR